MAHANSKDTSIAKSTSTIKRLNLSQRIKDAYYAIWSIVGIVLLVIVGIGMFGGGSWTENLHLTNASQTEQAAPQQPQQPTQEQLRCVSEKVGEKRFAELQQGQQPDQKETTLIQECLR